VKWSFNQATKILKQSEVALKLATGTEPSP